MNSAAELKRHNAQSDLQKAKSKVEEALSNDPMGLTIAQLMSVCRLSNKTVKNILAVINVQNDDGVYYLTSAPRAEVAEENITPMCAEPIEVVLDIKTEKEKAKRNVVPELLKILEESKKGLLATDIYTALQIDEKQFSNALWVLRKNHNIQRTGGIGTFRYQLIINEATVTPVSTVSMNQEESKDMTIKTTQNDNEEASVVPSFNELKSQMKVTVTQKSELKLECHQLTELMQTIFGLQQVDWFVEGGRLVGVYMAEEILL